MARNVPLLAGLLLGAIALRPQIVGVGPLFPAMQEDLDTSHAVIGLLGTIPVLCMGLFAPPAGYLASRFGTRRAIGLAILCVGVFGLLRSLAPDPWLIVALTWPIGFGMGIAGALAPVAVRERMGAASTTGMGAYTTGVQIGAFSAAIVAVPIADWLGGWRWSLGAFSVVSIGFALLWFGLVPATPRPAVRIRPPALPWRSPVAWLLVAIFVCTTVCYYGFNAWLPDYYVERGWSEARAGTLIGVSGAMAVPASFVVPWFSDRLGRQPTFVAASVVFCLSLLLFVVAPTGAWVWALAFGVAQGGLFALMLLLSLDAETSPARVGALVAMQLGLGYSVGAISPFMLGGIRDLTGSFVAVLWVVTGFGAVLILLSCALPRARRAVRATP